MPKKLTISIDDAVYEGLYRVVGSRRISEFIERLVRAHVLAEKLDQAYGQMAQDEAREGAAREWSDALLPDVGDDPR